MDMHFIILFINNFKDFRQLKNVSFARSRVHVMKMYVSDTLTLSQPGGADSAHHRRGRT